MDLPFACLMVSSRLRNSCCTTTSYYNLPLSTFFFFACLFFPPTHYDTEEARAVDAVKEVAKEEYAKENDFFFFHCTPEFPLSERIRQRMGVPENSLVFNNPPKDICHVYTGDFSVDDIRKFVDSVKAGTEKPFLRSEERTFDDR